MPTAVTQFVTTPPDALAKLSAGLAAYQAVSGRDASAILVQKGAQVVFGNKQSRFGATFDGLVTLFLRESPPDGKIYADAKARGFRLGTKAIRGQLSAPAYARASRMMGGNQTIIATGAGSRDEPLRFVRYNRRGRRVHYRIGRTSFAASGDFVGPLRAGEKRLNLRAVATFFEIQLRTAGRRFLGSGFLFQRWKKLAQSDDRRNATTWRILKNQNPRSSLNLLGEAALTGEPDAGNVELRITSFVPGTLTIGNARGLFSRVIASVDADIGTYLAKKTRAGAIASLKGLRPAA